MNCTPVEILHFLLQSGPFRISAFITHFERLDVHRVYDVTSPTIQITQLGTLSSSPSICFNYSRIPLAVWTLVCYVTSSSLR